MERWNSLPPIVRQTVLGMSLFLTGALLAFGYSYRPLHGALTWRVDHLEQRLDERNQENFALREELSTLKQDETERIDPATLEQVRTELEKTRTALSSAEKKIDRLDKKRRNANASADRWRKRYESPRDESSSRALPAAPVPRSETPESAAGAVRGTTGSSPKPPTTERSSDMPPRGPTLELEPAPVVPAPTGGIQPVPSTSAQESGMLTPAPAPSALP